MAKRKRRASRKEKIEKEELAIGMVVLAASILVAYSAFQDIIDLLIIAGGITVVLVIAGALSRKWVH